MHCGMFSRLGDEELIKTESKKIAKIDIYVCASKRGDPKIEQHQVS